MTLPIKPYTTTGIGSLPHLSPKEACEAVLETFDVPFWPQLPALSFRESMVAQYSEGMPFMRSDEEKGSVWVQESSSGDDLDRFYETTTEDSSIAISEQYAAGLYEFIRALGPTKPDFIKGHVTGPLTFALGLNDQDGKAIYFNEELREISLMLLKAKVKWQVELLRPMAKHGMLMFLDEPILSALGSTTYMGVERAEAIRMLQEVCDASKKAGALPGIHCCGRGEWPLLVEAGAGLISFDAYEFAQTLTIFPAEIKGFLEAGGLLAWGIIPTTEAIRDEDPDSIKHIFTENFEALSKHLPVDLLRQNILLTPSCGTGSLSVPEALKVFQLLMRLKEDILG